MKLRKLFLAFIACIAILTSCVNIDYTNDSRIPMNSKGEYAILFSNPVKGTKAQVTSVSGTGYDSFSLYAWNSNGDTIMNPYSIVEDGASAYKYDGINGQTTQYFKNNADSYSFIGIIPETDSTLNNGSLTVDVESFTVNDEKAAGNGVQVDSPKEFLYAYTNVTKDNYNQTVSLPFKHGNALLYLGFISDDANTVITDYVPGIPEIPAVPAVPGTPDTETYTNESVQFIDALVAGKSVQVPIGFVGSNSPKLTATNPTSLYIGTNNATYSYYAKDWLLSIKDAVNAQFVYYRLDAVTSSTSKTETTEDWESKSSNKKLYMMKLADGVNAADFAAGNDVFWNALCAHENDWVGGSPATSFKSMFQKAYDEGWRVIRINTNVAYKTFPTDMTVESTNANEVYVFLANNSLATVQVCTITPGTPGTPEIPAVPAVPGIDGIRVFSAQTDATDGYAKIAHTATAKATVSSTGLSFANRVTNNDAIQFSILNTNVPVGTTEADAAYSPTTFYAIPGDAGLTHFVVKVSYEYKGTQVYDVRVPIALPAAGLEAGKYYKYIINITSTANGTNDPTEANPESEDVDIVDNPIKVIVDHTDYTDGHTQVIKI